MNIAIIGCGIAGSNILKHILINDKFDEKTDNIYIFERREDLGVGIPFEEDTKYKMLNTPPSSMGLKEGDPKDFVQWLEENKKEPTNFENLIPREYYGQYIKEHYQEYFDHKNVNIIKEEVKDIELIDDNGKKTYKVKTDKFFDKDFDYVFLCLGHPEYADYYDLNGIDNYVEDPYPMNDRLSNFDEDKKIGLIGAGASSIDVFRYIMQVYDLKTPLYFLVRSSIFHTPLIILENKDYKVSIDDKWIEENINEDGFIDLNDILNTVKKDFEENNVDFDKAVKKVHSEDDNKIELYKELIKNKDQDVAFIQDYLEQLSYYFPKLFGLLSKLDQDKVNKEYDKKIDLFFSITPYETSKWLIESVDNKDVVFIKGLEEIKHKDNKFLVKADENVEMDYLINTTGFDFSVIRNSKSNELLNNLYDKKIIDTDGDENYINVTWPNCSVLSKKHGHLDNLFALGMWINNTHYRANCAISINTVTANVVNIFMDNIR